MLVIRFRRIGKRNKPTYRVVAAEHTTTPSGKFLVDLGFYNPHTKEKGLRLELVLEWLNKGAQPSNSVSKLLKELKVDHKSVAVLKKNKKAKKETPESAQQPSQPTAPNSEEVDTQEKE